MNRIIAISLVLLGALTTHAFAAQDAMITVEQAAIRERPTLDAKIIESREVGAKIRVSTYGKDGWYKTKSSIGQFGWIWQGDLTLLSYNADIKASNIDLPDRTHERRVGNHIPWLLFRTGFMLAPMITQIGNAAASLNLMVGGYVENSIAFWDDMRFAVRLLTVAKGFTLTTLGGQDVDMAPAFTGAMIGFEQDLNTSETHDVGVGLYGGINLGTNVQLSSPIAGTDPPVLVTQTIQVTGYPFLLNFSYRHYFARWFSVVGEAGFLYDYIPQFPITGFGSSHISTFGPVFSLGVQVGL